MHNIGVGVIYHLHLWHLLLLYMHLLHLLLHLHLWDLLLLLHLHLWHLHLWDLLLWHLLDRLFLFGGGFTFLGLHVLDNLCLDL